MAMLGVMISGLAACSAAQPDVPITEVWMQTPTSYLVYGTTFQAYLGLSRPEKWVEINWRYSATGNFHSPDALATQHVATSYWPTAVEAVSHDKIAVAGMQRSGDTKIEIWTVPPPSVLQMGGGEPLLILNDYFSSVEDVYDDNVVGRVTVEALFRLRGKPTSVIVQFADSNDLFELNWGSEPYPITQLLTTVQEPALALFRDTYLSGDHATLGYVYVFSDESALGQVHPLVLIDANRNGTIDSHGPMSMQAYHSANLGKTASFLELGGRPPPPYQ